MSSQISHTQSRLRIIVFFIVLMGADIVLCQDVLSLAKKYPGYNELIIEEFQSYHISKQKGKLSIIQNTKQTSIIVSQQGIHNNTESIISSELFPLTSYSAYTEVEKNGKLTKIPAKEVAENGDISSGIFHSDVKSKKLLFTNLEVGAKKIYDHTSLLLDPYLLHKFVFMGNVPILQSKLQITTDKDIEIGYKLYNEDSGLIKFDKKSKRGKNIYTWMMQADKPLKYESDSPGSLYVVPHIIIYIKSYKEGKKTIPILGTKNDLYNYYKNFVANLNTSDDEELKNISLSLTSHLPTDTEKIKAIYYWVKDHIKYVAFEYGYEGFIPRQAALVNQRKYGDCKDMSSIIHAMAKYAGIPNVHLCWIGTRELPYSYEEIPTPTIDNHMIACIQRDGEYIFLDATDRETSFGLPTGFIQEKEAMVGIDDHFEIVKIPAVSPDKNLIEDHISITLDGDKILGKGSIKMHGLSRSHFLSLLGDALNEKRFDIVKNLVLKGNNKFKLKDYKEKNIKDRDLPYVVDYDFTLENYMVSISKESYLSILLDKPFEKNIIEADRRAPYDFELLTKHRYVVEMEIPKGKKISNIPDELVGSNDLMDYSIRYVQDDQKITSTLEISNKKLLLSPTDFELWNQTIKGIKAKYQETIVISML